MFQWAAHYTDDDVLRYAQKLYRHYCIEGKRTPYGDFPYVLTHVANPDFADGLDGWQVEAAAQGSITASSYAGLGKLQGRWADVGVGDRCALLVRNAEKPNKVTQTIKNLEPGRLYTMKYIAADLDHLTSNEEVGLWAELEGVAVIADRSFRCVMPSSPALDLAGFNRQNRAYTTYSQVMFRAKAATAELTFSDWKDGQPAGPAGQRIAFNFVEVQPFFE